MQYASLIKDLDFYCALMIFLVNMLGLFLWKIKKVLQLLMLFRKLEKNLIVAKQSPKDAGRATLKDVNQTKYELIKEVNFTTVLF